MIILAKAVKGHEFLYSAISAHKVSKASAEKIRDVLNGLNYKLNNGEIWHVFEVENFERAAAYAETQKFTTRKGVLREVIG